MRKLILVSVVLIASSLFGCSEDKQNDGSLSTTAAVNNNAPGAKDAPVAPRDPSIIMPGGGGGGKKKGPSAPSN